MSYHPAGIESNENDQVVDARVRGDFKVLRNGFLFLATLIAAKSIPWALKTFHTPEEVVLGAAIPPMIAVAFALGFNYLRGFIE